VGENQFTAECGSVIADVFDPITTRIEQNY